MLSNDVILRPYLKQMTLLCVDASPLMQSIYEDIFTTLFQAVFIANDGKEGLDFYQEHDIDLVLCEYDLPRMNGIEMIAQMRQLKSFMPIILVTQTMEPHIFTEAFKHRVCNFVQKPFDTTDLLEAVERAVKIIIADKFIHKEQQRQLELLEKKVAYGDYQEELSFQKELSMIRNDFYYRLISQDCEKRVVLADFLYMPKDILSGDSYSARKLGEGKALFFMVDGMGKGVSASVSAMMSVSFINHLIDKVIQKGLEIDLQKLIRNVLLYVQGILLEEEILSIVFFYINPKEQYFEYASFSMPSILIMNQRNEVTALKSNNPPMNKYVNTFKINQMTYKEISKILIYSDGLVENSLKEEGTYAQYIKEDFKDAMTREDLRQKIVKRIGEQEDDITFILLNLIAFDDQCVHMEITTTLEAVEASSEWFLQFRERWCQDEKLNINANFAFSELLMNAYEHGNLCITKNQKHNLIDKNEYFPYLAQKEKESQKKINITLHVSSNPSGEKYLFTYIEDEGEGFDTAILSTVFGLKRTFNGRGIFMSKRASLGIYYNSKGNLVMFVTKL